MHVSRLPIVVCCLAAIACGKSSPAPPVVTPPAGTETITGTERIGWDQRAADAAELATIGYVLYVDGTRTPLTAVTCSSEISASGFACNTRLPALSSGAHTLQLASFVTDGAVLESERSAALRVTVTPQTSAALRPRATPASPSSQVWDGTSVETLDHVSLRVERVAEGLDAPTDLAFAPDGRMLVPNAPARFASCLLERALRRFPIPRSRWPMIPATAGRRSSRSRWTLSSRARGSCSPFTRRRRDRASRCSRWLAFASPRTRSAIASSSSTAFARRRRRRQPRCGLAPTGSSTPPSTTVAIRA